MNKNKQLNVANRKVVETLLQENYTVNQIAIKLGKHRSTIYREISRNPKDAYQADLADFIITKIKIG